MEKDFIYTGSEGIIIQKEGSMKGKTFYKHYFLDGMKQFSIGEFANADNCFPIQSAIQSKKINGLEKVRLKLDVFVNYQGELSLKVVDINSLK